MIALPYVVLPRMYGFARRELFLIQLGSGVIGSTLSVIAGGILGALFAVAVGG